MELDEIYQSRILRCLQTTKRYELSTTHSQSSSIILNRRRRYDFSTYESLEHEITPSISKYHLCFIREFKYIFVKSRIEPGL